MNQTRTLRLCTIIFDDTIETIKTGAPHGGLTTPVTWDDLHFGGYRWARYFMIRYFGGGYIVIWDPL
jgi:hypothetical protein